MNHSTRLHACARQFGALILSAALLAVSACGGGGGDDSAVKPADTGSSAPVSAAPVITVQALSQSVVAGTGVSFSVTATGDSLSYQWQLSTNNGDSWADVGGATSRILTISQVPASMSGYQYRAIIKSGTSSVTSSMVTLTVTAAVEAPAITQAPQAQTQMAGGSVSFSVTATGTALSYQWQFSLNGTDWTDIPGATSATFTIAVLTTADNNKLLRALVSNALDTAPSAPAKLTVTPATAAPNILSQPASTSVTVPNTASFEVAASGTPAPSYQWQVSSDGVNFSDIPGATGSRYTTSATTVADNGKRYRVHVSNGSGALDSSAATLTATAGNVAASITTPPTAVTITAPATATFTVAVAGNPTPTIQWMVSTDGKAFSNIAGATAATYTTPATTVANSGTRYQVVVSNVLKTVTSTPVALTVNASVPSSGAARSCGPVAQAVQQGKTLQVKFVEKSDANKSSVETVKFVGPATFEGRSLSEFDFTISNTFTNTVNGAATTTSSLITSRIFISFDASTGVITDYGSLGHYKDTETGATGTTILDSDMKTVYTPPFVDKRYSLDKGQAISQESTSIESRFNTTVAGMKLPDTSNTETFSEEITFLGIEAITVPAGTFQACKFKTATPGESGYTLIWELVGYGIDLQRESYFLNVLEATYWATSVTLDGVPYK
jgi:hypothetical protein